MLSAVKLKELEYVVACWPLSLTEKDSFPNKKRQVEKEPDGKTCLHISKRAEICYMLLINDREEMDGRGRGKSDYRQST